MMKSEVGSGRPLAGKPGVRRGSVPRRRASRTKLPCSPSELLDHSVDPEFVVSKRRRADTAAAELWGAGGQGPEFADEGSPSPTPVRIETPARKITHDLSNVVMVLTEQIDMARAKLPAAHPAAMPLEFAAKAADEARELLLSLRQLHKRPQMALCPLNLSDLLTRYAGFLRRVLSPRIQLIEDVQRDPPVWIQGDASQLNRVLINLTVNAREAIAARGRVTLSLRCPDVPARRCRASGDERPAEAVITISDTGSGIPPEARSRVFEPSFSNKPAGGAERGLGLSIVRDVVAAHNGRVVLRSRLGRGTSATVVIPACLPSAPTSARSLRVREPASRATILVVGADKDVTSVIRSALFAADYHVICAQDGRGALKLMDDHATDVRSIVLDLDSVAPSDVVFMKTLRRWAGFPGAVVLSGSASTVPGEELVGEDFLLLKPLCPSDLTECVARALSLSA